MKRQPPPSQRVNWGWVLAVIGALIAGYIGYVARVHKLDEAGHRASEAIAPALAREPRDTSLQKQVAAWVADSRSKVAYLNVRGSDGHLLASAGAWSNWFEDWLSPTTARRGRARAYRLLCAESNRPLIGADGAGVGGLRIGITWWSIVMEGGWALWLAMLLLLFGIGWAVRERRAAKAAIFDPAPVCATAEPAAGDAQPDSISGRKRQGAQPKTRSAERRRGRGVPTASNAGFQPIGQRADKPAAEIPSRPPPEIETAPAAAVVDQVQAPPVPAADSIEPEIALRASTREPEPGPALYFVPIWQHAADGPLAGAAVTLMTPADGKIGSSWGSVEQLVSSPQNEAERVALTVRLIGRLSRLQANWRRLELPRALLFLTLPPGMFAFDHAAETWADAFKTLNGATRDLVLCVERVPERIRQTLPVRWALAEPGAVPPVRYRLIAAQDSLLGSTRSAPLIGPAAPVCLPQPNESAIGRQAMPLGPRELARLIRHREAAF